MNGFRYFFSIHLPIDSLCKHEGMRAVLMKLGTPQFYKSFKPFKPVEYKQDKALYIFKVCVISLHHNLKIPSRETICTSRYLEEGGKTGMCSHIRSKESITS
jgi:hypothetical protein